MAYEITFLPGAQEDFDALDSSARKLAHKQLRKLEEKPELGQPLGKRANIDLTGYRKMLFNRKKHRIVYRIHKEQRKVGCAKGVRMVN